MKQLLFILLFLCNWKIPTTAISINMKNKLIPSEAYYSKPGNHKIISPDFSNNLNNKSLNLANNNPGNLRSFKTGEYRVFNTLEEGYAALLYDLNLKITGRSVWTDSTTTIYDFITIYAPIHENDIDTYLRIFCSETGLQETDLLKTQLPEIIARGIIKVENVNIYCQLYSSNKK